MKQPILPQRQHQLGLHHGTTHQACSAAFTPYTSASQTLHGHCCSLDFTPAPGKCSGQDSWTAADLTPLQCFVRRGLSMHAGRLPNTADPSGKHTESPREGMKPLECFPEGIAAQELLLYTGRMGGIECAFDGAAGAPVWHCGCRPAWRCWPSPWPAWPAVQEWLRRPLPGTGPAPPSPPASPLCAPCHPAHMPWYSTTSRMTK